MISLLKKKNKPLGLSYDEWASYFNVQNPSMWVFRLLS